MSKKRYVQLLRATHGFLVIFAVVAFFVTCSLCLFVTVMTRTLGLTLTDAAIGTAAKLTFVNVIALSLLFAIADALHRHYTVKRPARLILAASARIMAGDFSARVPLRRTLNSEDEFNRIADCLNRMAQALSEMQTLRTDFIANVSHELKTPLAVMQSYAAMLTQPQLPADKRDEYANGISQAARRLALLIDNILKLNKLEQNSIKPSPAVYDLSAQVCECLLNFEQAWEKKGLQIETDIEDEVAVCADAQILSLVWNNLFSNAIKFTESGGTVSLQIKTEGDFAVVCVRDTGCGISPEVGKRIFDKFYQGDTSHAAEGNGLGLALVRRVIELTDSEISVESEPGRGTAFTVKIKKASHG